MPRFTTHVVRIGSNPTFMISVLTSRQPQHRSPPLQSPAINIHTPNSLPVLCRILRPSSGTPPVQTDPYIVRPTIPSSCGKTAPIPSGDAILVAYKYICVCVRGGGYTGERGNIPSISMYKQKYSVASSPLTREKIAIVFLLASFSQLKPNVAQELSLFPLHGCLAMYM